MDQKTKDHLNVRMQIIDTKMSQIFSPVWTGSRIKTPVSRLIYSFLSTMTGNQSIFHLWGHQQVPYINRLLANTDFLSSILFS